MLERIQSIDIHAYQKYGYWGSDGHATGDSWKDPVVSQVTAPQSKWAEVVRSSESDRKLYEKVQRRVIELVDSCPEDRHLLHGDFGFNNILVQGNVITGVLDWGDSQYGDFLYDVAWMDYFSWKFSYSEAYLRYYEEREGAPANYKERLLCYKLWVGLCATGFFASTRQMDKYSWSRDRLSGLLL
jgi:hygromycin-B 4-O-kinase